MHACMHVCKYVYMYMCTCICLHAYVDVDVDACVYTCMYTKHTYIHTCVCYTYVCVYIYMHMNHGPILEALGKMWLFIEAGVDLREEDGSRGERGTKSRFKSLGLASERWGMVHVGYTEDSKTWGNKLAALA